MPLPSGGQIDMNQIQTEFGGSPQIELGEYYKGGPYVSYSDNAPNVPTGGQIAMSNFWGASKNVVDITTNGLRLYYDFGKTSSYPGSGNFVYDLSGNGRHGNFYNGAYWAYDSNGSSNGTKSRLVFDGVDDFLTPNSRFIGNWTTSNTIGANCWTGRGPYTVCMWFKPYREYQAETVFGTVNAGVRDIVAFSTNRGGTEDYQRDDNRYRTLQNYIRDGIDDGDNGYSVQIFSHTNPYVVQPCYVVYPFDVWAAYFQGYFSFVAWIVIDSYWHPIYGYNYLRIFKFPTVGSTCGVSSRDGNWFQENGPHQWPSSFNCFEYAPYWGALNRRGTNFRHFAGEIAQIQVYDRSLYDYEINYNFDQHRNRYL